MPIVYEICIFVAIMLNPSIKKSRSSKQNVTHFIGNISHRTDYSKSLPKRNVTKQQKLTKMEMSLTHTSKNRLGCFSLL